MLYHIENRTELARDFPSPTSKSSGTVVAGPHLLDFALVQGLRHKSLCTARIENLELETHLLDLVQRLRSMKQQVEALKAIGPEV